MHTRREALSLARQSRTCPPPRIKNDPEFKAEVRRHTDICPFCSTYLKDELDAWHDLIHSLEPHTEPRPHKTPAAGQIRALDPGLACWKDDFFYTPPLVALLETGSGEDRKIMAAQIYDDTALAGPGDLVIPNEMVSGIRDIFIEPWNIYTLDKEFLGPCLGTLDPMVTEAVLKMDDDPAYLPDWALRTMPLKHEDPRRYFREIEIETGFTFSAMAASRLLAEMPRFSFGLEELKAVVKEKISGISWDWIPDTIEECMAAMRFPSHALPMRAADTEDRTITANYFLLTEEGVSEVRPVECRIVHSTLPPDPYSVSGRIEGLPEDISGDAFQCFVKDPQNKCLHPCSFMWEGTGKFMAAFDRPLNSDESLALIIAHPRSK